MATRESSQARKKKRKNPRRRGGASMGELEEKGLDGEDRQSEGYRQPVKKRNKSQRGEAADADRGRRSGCKC